MSRPSLKSRDISVKDGMREALSPNSSLKIRCNSELAGNKCLGSAHQSTRRGAVKDWCFTEGIGRFASRTEQHSLTRGQVFGVRLGETLDPVEHRWNSVYPRRSLRRNCPIHTADNVTDLPGKVSCERVSPSLLSKSGQWNVQNADSMSTLVCKESPLCTTTI